MKLTMPPFPKGFSEAQLSALRDLTCYALGHRSYPHLFPKKVTDLVRPTDTDITKFKVYGAKLDYDGTKEKIQAIYTRVFNFLNEEPSNHRNLFDLIELVYPQNKRGALEKYGEFLYRHFEVNPETMHRYITATRGVYKLYRFGERAATAAELVKSILAVYEADSGSYRRLQFRLLYRGGRLGESGSKHKIEGIIVPTRTNYYFMGVDDGTGNTPCILITRHPTEFKGRSALHGLMLRLNTLNHISAARVLCWRIDNLNADDPTSSIDEVFARCQDEANIYSKTDPEIAAEVSDIIKSIDNYVDMKNQLTLRDLPAGSDT